MQNQLRARSLQDTTVLPDLCMKHREVLTNMLPKFQLLQDLLRRINAAKDELSANLHTRLRYVIELKRLRHILLITAILTMSNIHVKFKQR